ncbi:hypothetical protein EMIHUDRAFT_213491 [Emiliania huxleyi CCMP1516]|uniref:D-isomer specific 2-hydroxyacid dehydrogenase NAD-binding domain-containing protein n=2 Tax=Emiliania huxleyi TaxID=2903 RepID=A0A0D3IN63_EMIH1|nr:hypothetical protein EMIHUDRAFT_213491 [Emiliania huxleyi CCMP1516]EOD12698.1 hypothetical protein EMIHUDRAFT_213491 [Emiliania huxleyi CCMP1516]|eukprot:XP_005765127.1 hypothetical protein EMIHUDRAFT_213491 [Emiliania huxleyi CCMP1516]
MTTTWRVTLLPFGCPWEDVCKPHIDVFPSEPKKNGEELFESPLCGLPNVILTPHIGGSTEEVQAAIGVEVASAMIKCINTGVPYGAVNFPQVDNHASRRHAPADQLPP